MSKTHPILQISIYKRPLLIHPLKVIKIQVVLILAKYKQIHSLLQVKQVTNSFMENQDFLLDRR
jgi:hypothetical protein